MSDSFWKKEISFGRKPKEPKAEAPAIDTSFLEPDVESVPFWKKEVSLGRKKTPAAEAEPLPVAEPEAPAPLTPAPVALAPVPPEAAPVVEAESEVERPFGVPPGDYGWLTTDFDPSAVPEDMPTIAAPPVSLPTGAPPLAVAEAAPVEPAPPAEPEPEPASETPKSQKAPFWKKELSFSRGPKQPKEPKQPKASKIEPEFEERKRPFWKRELSFSRGAKAPKQPKEKQPPFWKRELKLGRGPKQPKAPKPMKQKASSAAKGTIVGLKIGASQVAAARVTMNGGPQLLQYAREPLADGVVVGGELRDVESLAQALRDLFTKNKLPKKAVRLGIANNRIGVRTFEITGIDEPRQLANAIRFRAQETLPIPLEEAVLDWQVLDEWRDEESGQLTRRVLLVVAYRELVDRYLAACKKAGIRLTGIDLEAFAMLRALDAPLAPDAPDPAGAKVVVNVGHDRSTFAVSTGKVCEFTRVLGWGGQSLSVAIARALDITPSEATPIKHALSLVATAVQPEEFSAESLAAARTAVTNELQAFARELVSSLRFYQNQPGSLGIGEVILTGGTAHLPGFASELNRLIGVPVYVGDPLNRVALPKKFREPDDFAIGSLTVAIGLGIDD